MRYNDTTIEVEAAQALYDALDGSIRPSAFTCRESDAIVAFLRKHLGQFEADVWAADHAEYDEEGDAHYGGIEELVDNDVLD